MKSLLKTARRKVMLGECCALVNFCVCFLTLHIKGFIHSLKCKIIYTRKKTNDIILQAQQEEIYVPSFI